MKKKITLLTNRLRIRTSRIKDVTPEYIRGLNDPEVNKYLVNTRIFRQTKKRVESFNESI